MKNDRNSYEYFLKALLAVFIFRVIAQLIQAIYPVSFLPPFDAWQSGALPYSVLLAFQLVIIVICGWIIWKFHTGPVRPSPRVAAIYLTLGGIYFTVMLFRLVAGFRFAADHPWVGAHIPTFFHLVLASLLLTVGFYHSPNTDKIVARLGYPAVMVFAITGHSLCVQNSINLYIATYAPVLLGALAITFLEQNFPYRNKWLPNQADVLNDATYMVLIQVLLPKLLGFFVAIVLLGAFHEQAMTFDGLWPHDLPVFAQVVVMLIGAELMRYWVHRLAHKWTPLWQFHAVHHSPHKLYWVNVGRFHPIEKALQYLFDALPFIILGVSENVLAMYFVFYAINGFFQHCNIELRLGFLNYIISGPELHRWHHSKLVEESNNNYGNNLIIWDLLFGTWFLPKNRLVDDLGLINREYPIRFLDQLKTPFIKGLDKIA